MDFINLKAQQDLIKKPLDNAIQRVLSHGHYVMGPEVFELEEKLSEFIGNKYCVTSSSGTTALLLALLALDISSGDEVITTPFTFVSPVEVISLLKATPVFVDIDPLTFNLDPKKLEKAITEKTKAIIAVGLFGQTSNLNEINKIAEKYNIPVIEDAAQSFGATHYNQYSCNLTKIACTSFFPAKPLGCYGEGGACFTNDDEIAEKLKYLRHHGEKKRYVHDIIGINGRLETLQAAILLEKLKIFPNEIKLRQEVAENYTMRIKNIVDCPHILPENTSVYAQYTIKTDNREKLQQALSKKQIPSAIHYPNPIHFQPAYRYLGYMQGDFPVAEMVSKRVLSLPMHPYLSVKDINYICDFITQYVESECCSEVYI